MWTLVLWVWGSFVVIPDFNSLELCELGARDFVQMLKRSKPNAGYWINSEPRVYFRCIPTGKRPT